MACSQSESGRGLVFLAVLCRVLMWMPLWSTVLAFYLSDEVQNALCCGALLACGTVVTLWARRWHIRFVRRNFRIAVMILPVLLPIGSAAVWGVRQVTEGAVLGALMAAVSLIVLAVTAGREPERLYTIGTYAALLTFSVLEALLLYFALKSIPTTLLLAVMGIGSGGYFLLRNQFMLRRMVNRRHVLETPVPAPIRRANLWMTGGIFLLLIVLFVCRTPIGSLLLLMRDAAFGLVRGAVGLLEWLTALIRGDQSKLPELPSGEAGNAPLSAAEGSPFWLLLWIPIAFVTYVIWRMFLSEWLYDMRIAAGDLWRRLRGKNPRTERMAGVPNDGAYMDVETIERPVSARKEKRTWKKALRTWHRQPDSPEKFYAGYKLLLHAPAWEHAYPRDCETVLEIRTKWAALFGGELDAATEDFQKHRYAEQPLPPQAIADIARALEAAAG